MGGGGGGWLGGWLYKHENITNSASNSVQVGAEAELGNMVAKCFVKQAGAELGQEKLE